MMPQQTYSHILDTCDVPTTVLGTAEEGMDLLQKNIVTMLTMITDDDDTDFQ